MPPPPLLWARVQKWGQVSPVWPPGCTAGQSSGPVCLPGHSLLTACIYVCTCLYVYMCVPFAYMCVPNCMYTCVHDRDREIVQLAPSQLGCSSRTHTAHPVLDGPQPPDQHPAGPRPRPMRARWAHAPAALSPGCEDGCHPPQPPTHRGPASRDASSPRWQRKLAQGVRRLGPAPTPWPCGPPFSHLSSEGDDSPPWAVVP